VKIRVTLKDPDTMQDAVDDAVSREKKPDGISKQEWLDIREARADRIKGAISDKWMDYGEYLVVEFTIDEDGAATEARVVPSE
jgi:hypothetical protein